MSPGTVSSLNEKAFESTERWRNRPLEHEYRYVYVNGIYLKRAWGSAFENVAVMVAVGVNDDGCREVIGAAEGFTESAECWREFLSWLESRGLRGVHMFAGDKASDMVGALVALGARRGRRLPPPKAVQGVFHRLPGKYGLLIEYYDGARHGSSSQYDRI